MSDNGYKYLQLLIDDRYILFSFKGKQKNKYLTVRRIAAIWVSTDFILNERYLCSPPIRNIENFTRRVIFEYNGNMDILAREWIKEERKRITKDVKIQG